jgi:GATA-binding protein, other eukaryote
MGDKLDKEKGRYVLLFNFLLPSTLISSHPSAIESLEVPDFKHNASTDLIQQRVVESERPSEASQNACRGMIKYM